MITDSKSLDLDGQQILLTEWISLANQSEIPCRDRLKPSQFLSELAYVSILEARSEDDFVFRISGSEVKQLLGREARGYRLDNFPGFATRRSGKLSMQRAIISRQPVAGQSKMPGDRIHFWLRLPLMGADGEIDQILCHDRVLNREEIESGVTQPRYGFAA